MKIFVSIQLPFLFNRSKQQTLHWIECFNTASVLIQRKFSKNSDEQRKFQYSFCSYSTGCPLCKFLLRFRFQYSFCSYSTKKTELVLTLLTVSIQLLFLFNCTEIMQILGLKEFQYSFCSYSTNHNRFCCLSVLRFQYSFCSYSTRYVNFISFMNRQFQYSFCSYSTSNWFVSQWN